MPNQFTLPLKNFIERVSPFVEELFPDYVRGEYDTLSGSDTPKVIDFMQAYYEWQENVNGVVYDAMHYPDAQDIDKAVEQYANYFYDEFLVNFPKKFASDKTFALKNIVDYYRAKGTEKSFKLFFRMLYNTSAELDYPSRLIMRASDGLARKDVSIRVHSNANMVAMFALAGTQLNGSNSGASAVVEDVFVHDSKQHRIVELLLNNDSISGAFEPNETLYATNAAGVNVNLSATVSRVLSQPDVYHDRIEYYANVAINQYANNYTILSFHHGTGLGYKIGERIAVADATGIDGDVVVAKTETGPLDQVLVLNSGDHFLPGDELLTLSRYFNVRECENVYASGEHIIVSTSNARATVEKHDFANNQIWYHYNNAERFRSGDVLIGTESNARSILINSISIASRAARIRVGKVETLGNVVAASILYAGEGYVQAPEIVFANSNAQAIVLRYANDTIDPYGDIQIDGLVNCGANAVFTSFGSNIGRIIALDLSRKAYGESIGAGYNYSNPSLTAPEKYALSDKQIYFFVTDEINDDIQTSNAQVWLNMTATGTFTNARIDALWASSYQANAYSLTNTLCQHVASFQGTRGTIDEDMRIQDGYYYQAFSYLIKVNEYMDVWSGALKQLLHPAGFAMFSAAQVNTTETITPNSEFTIEIF